MNRSELQLETEGVSVCVQIKRIGASGCLAVHETCNDHTGEGWVNSAPCVLVYPIYELKYKHGGWGPRAIFCQVFFIVHSVKILFAECPPLGILAVSSLCDLAQWCHIRYDHQFGG